ncbi:MAG: FlgD immunoglobulin-like domain containing protein [Calditrichia bacterium]
MEFLSGGLQTQSLDNTDISTLVGTGPLSIPPNSSVEIAFAVIGANTLADLQQHADNAQTLWDNPTAIDDLPNPVADDFELAQNYPNPFNPTTTIEYRLATAGNISLKIFNIAGQEVRTLVNAAQTAGRYSVNWDGRDNRGMPVASGVYFYRLETQAAVQSRKMLLIR